MRNLIVIVVAGTICIMSALAAFAQAGQRVDPQAAAGVFPFNGQSRAHAAQVRLGLARAEARNPFLAPDAKTHDMALDAYRLEPIEPEAIAIIARGQGGGDLARRSATLSAAHALSRRSTMLNTELMVLEGRTGNIGRALQLLDEILRRETAAHGQVLDQMVAYAGDSSLAPLLLDLLANDAPWRAQFWRQVAQSPAGLKNAANLRIGFARRGGTNDPAVDKMLIAGLAGQNRFDDAARLATTLFAEARGVDRPAAGNLLREGDFAAGADLFPFDWRLTSTGDFGAGRLSGTSGMLISALSGSRGVAAEQLVALPAAPLRLAAEIDAPAPGTAEQLLVELRCAEGSQSVIFSGTLGDLPARIPRQECKWAWLRFIVKVPPDASAADWTVHRATLSRADT